jgi:hypothetical protein
MDDDLPISRIGAADAVGPHHHLALLAVSPAHQHRGPGTAGSRRLYARHGYRAGEPFQLPDGAPFWPMWREPNR